MEAVEVGTKRCSKCGEVKDCSAFSRDPTRKDGLYLWCKGCRNARVKVLYEASPRQRLRMDAWVKANKERVKACRIAKKYGLTKEMQSLLRDMHGGMCACCRIGKQELVDHCHELEKQFASTLHSVRGMVCESCNLGAIRMADKLLAKHGIIPGTQIDRSKQLLREALYPERLIEYVCQVPIGTKLAERKEP